MVSQLWAAADAGDAAQVQLILTNTDSPVDIEIRDDKGATALVQAVMNGHGQVVKVLLDAGSDPYVSSAHGSIDQLTRDAYILDLLADARNKRTQSSEGLPQAAPVMNGMREQVPNHQFIPPLEGFQPPHEYPVDPSKSPYYGQPPSSYMYYPMAFPGSTMLPDGTPAPFYPPLPPPHVGAPSPDGGNNLPPPEIARQIPCRYFPACRYGPSCMFAHPQGPYFQGSLPPPAQYPSPYDPMAPNPYAGYYGMPQQTPYPPNGMSPASNAMSPPPAGMQSPLPQPMQHTRSGSEAMIPMQPPFSPNGHPPSLPYGVAPTGFHAPGPIPGPPMMGPPAGSAPQPNGMIYPPTSPTSHSGAMHAHSREPSAALGMPPFQPEIEGGVHNGINGYAHPPPNSHPPDVYTDGSRMHPRDGFISLRRGGARRMGNASISGSRVKPPCAFYPIGKCRNGDTCKFPHVLPAPGEVQYNGKPGPRSKPQSAQVSDQLADKMSALQLRTDVGPTPAQVNGVQMNGHASHGQMNGAPRPHNGFRNGYANSGKRGMNMNGHANGFGSRDYQPRQRVPSADDFPVLAGSTTPPTRSPGGLNVVPNGPTAAQVLQAPPPMKKITTKASSVTKGSENGTDRASSPSEISSDISGPTQINGISGVNGSVPTSEVKPSLSFAKVATNGVTSTPETISTVSVSA